MTNPNDPAFLTEPKTFYTRQTPPDCDTQFGLTKREWYAGLAMQGIQANANFNVLARSKQIAIEAVECADALIEALNK